MKFTPSSTVHSLAQGFARRWRDVASTMTLEVVSLASLLVIFPLTIRGLGPQLYGEYTVLYLIFGLVGLWVYASPTAALVQLILQLDYNSERLLPLGRRQVLMTGTPGAIVGTAAAVGVLGWNLLMPAILVLVADLLFTSLANLNIATVMAVDGVVPASRLRILHPLFRAGGVAALALADGISIVGLVAVNIAASGGLLLISSYVVHRRGRTVGREEREPSGRELLRYSSYYASSMSTNAVQNEGEKLVLASTRQALEVGQYAAVYKVVSITLIPLGAVGTAANRWSLVRDNRAGAQLTRSLRLSMITVVYGLVVGAAIFGGRDIIQWVVGNEFDDAALIASWLCLLPLLHGLAELPPMGLLGLTRNRPRMFMGFATSLVALLSYLLLVPSFGWRGAVLGTYISEIASIVAGWVLLVRYQRLADAA